MELISQLLQTAKKLKIKCIGKMIQFITRIQIIKVKNCKKPIGNGSPKKKTSNYMRSKLKHTNKQSVTFLRNIKIRFVIKPLPRIILTLKVKSLRKKQSIKPFGAGLKEKD